MQRAATVAGLALLGWLCISRSGQLAAALTAVPPAGFALALALHGTVLVARSEAWRLTLAAVNAPALPRRTIHAVNAGAFMMGSLQSQAALPTRVALLGRHPEAKGLRPGQIGVADVPIFLLELLFTGLLAAAAAKTWWAAAAAVAVATGALLGARTVLQRFPDRPMARGLAVLGDVRRRRILVCLVGVIAAATACRIWLVLAVCGLPHQPAAVATVFAALGVFGLLPLGPAATPGATLAVLGTSGVGQAIAAGLVLSASSIGAVLLYSLAAVTISSRRPAANRRESQT